jgi:HNH endonuclease
MRMLTSRFWSKAIVGDPFDCWKWQSARNKDGYGSFGTGEGTKTILAHRFAWSECRGEIPEGMYVLHRCDEPSCVNPHHLFLGTQKDNVHDCAKKGRRNQSRIRKTTPEQRTEMRRLYATGEWTFAALGRKFGVTYQSVRHHVT